MSNQERRKSKRLAALYDEQDGDFKFLRASKRVRTSDGIEEEPSKPAPVTQPRKSSRTKQSKEAAAQPPPMEEATAAPTKRRSTRRKASVDASGDALVLTVPKKQTRRSTRRATIDEELHNTAVLAEDDDRMDIVGGTPVQQSQPGGDVQDVKKVALPMSDTPVINRNKEMRRKAGAGNRRSSLGSRGRRASSLIEMGHTALPHKEVAAAEFYKHIESEGLPEPRRMKQLLTWCGERSLSEKPPLGSKNSGAILGARAIQDQLLKDFQSKSQFSNWFDREDAPAVEAVKQPNPRNIEHAQKIEQLEEKIKRHVLTT
ncbi:hypothetical protein jhhlp_006202 [Lomentospora prolificans]|uniref:Kinetochore protein mis13 n=1 Tax=Lomentospora prolificans TaxID=41688 RepID=A0A2N3N594_9PEZI|nr:hypothetical protein jhhlp_006202 [Lomentospora prolificans]